MVRRNKVVFAALTSVAAALVIGLGTSTWLFFRERTARQETRAEAAKSGQIAQFLKEMLESVGPGVAKGRDATLLKEVLDKTAERVGKELSHQPAIEAELRSTIGDVYSDTMKTPVAHGCVACFSGWKASQDRRVMADIPAPSNFSKK